MHKCKAHSRRFCGWCVMTTIGFPIEHVVWERVPLFSAITHLLGV